MYTHSTAENAPTKPVTAFQRLYPTNYPTADNVPYMSVYGANTGISRLEPAALLPAVKPLKNEQKSETMNQKVYRLPPCLPIQCHRTHYKKPIARAESVKATNYPTQNKRAV